jgi:hypothetical protein
LTSRLAAVVSALVAAALAGCYGSTEPATDIGPESATLNARGTANDGPAYSDFEYWLTGRGGPHLHIGGGPWPAGASGPISQKVAHLAAASGYSFRACGRDVNDSEYTCAQSRTFSTKAPVEDSVYGGWWAGCCTTFSIDARSGPSGDKPGGSMHYGTLLPQNGHSIGFTGIVTCMRVDGATATVGALGNRKESPPDTTTRASLLVQIVDGHLQQDQYSDNPLQEGATLPDCSNGSFSRHLSLDLQHELIVNDAHP